MYPFQPDRCDFCVLVRSTPIRTSERHFSDVFVVLLAECLGQRSDYYSGCGRWGDGDSGGVCVLEMDAVSRLESDAGGRVDAWVGGIGEVDLCNFLCLVAGDVDCLAASGGKQPLGTLR